MQVNTNSYESYMVHKLTNYVSLLGLWFKNMPVIPAFPNSKISKDVQNLIRFIFFTRLVGKIDWIKLLWLC
jgi:hypothetical protein